MSASSGAAAPLNRAFSPLLLIALWTLRFYLAEITGYRKTADSRISTNILVFDAGNILGKLLLALDVALTGDHDALGLGGNRRRAWTQCGSQRQQRPGTGSQ